MANWQGFTLTEKGLALQAKIDAGLATLKFTKISIGSGSSSNNSALTDLVKREKDLKITSCSAAGNIVKLVYILTNEGVTQKFKEREMGLFAKDPDDGEIMFAYMIDSDPDTMPAEGSTTVVAKRTTLNLTFSNTGNVSAYLDSTGFISWGDTITGKSDTAAADDNDRHIPSTSWVHKKFENLKSSYVKGIAGSNDTLTVTKGDGSSSKITINHVANANTATSANSVAITHFNEINVNGKITNSTNHLWLGYRNDDWTNTAELDRWKIGNLKGGLADCEAKNFIGNLKGNADSATTATTATNANTATSANSVAITHGNEINVNGNIASSANQLWLGYRSEAGYTGAGIARWKMGNLMGALADCEAKNFIGDLKGNADSATSAQKSNTQEISDNSDNIATTQFVTKKFDEAITGDTTNALSSWYAHKWGNRKIVECFGQVAADSSVIDVKFPVTGTPRNIMICDIDYFVETDTPVIPALSIDGRTISNTGFKIFSTMPSPGAVRWHATLIV